MSENLANYRRWNTVSAPRVREHEVIDLRDDVATPEALLLAQSRGLPGATDREADVEDDVIDLRDVVNPLERPEPISPEGIDGEWERMAKAVQTNLAIRAAAKLDAGHMPLGLHFDSRS